MCHSRLLARASTFGQMQKMCVYVHYYFCLSPRTESVTTHTARTLTETRAPTLWGRHFLFDTLYHCITPDRYLLCAHMSSTVVVLIFSVIAPAYRGARVVMPTRPSCLCLRVTLLEPFRPLLTPVTSLLAPLAPAPPLHTRSFHDFSLFCGFPTVSVPHAPEVLMTIQA
jgi:hypothetical protein